MDSFIEDKGEMEDDCSDQNPFEKLLYIQRLETDDVKNPAF